MRLQLGNLKRKAKELQQQVQAKDIEIAKMREKTSDKAQDSMKDELRRAYEVLRHLKKKVGPHAFNEEYGVVVNEIREALDMPPETLKKKPRKPSQSQNKTGKRKNPPLHVRTKEPEQEQQPNSEDDDQGEP